MSIAAVGRAIEIRSAPHRGSAAVTSGSTVMATEEIDDAALGRAIGFGLSIGTLVMFLVTLVIGLGAGLALRSAVVMAVWPGIVSGLYFGGAAFLLRQPCASAAKAVAAQPPSGLVGHR